MLPPHKTNKCILLGFCLGMILSLSTLEAEVSQGRNLPETLTLPESMKIAQKNNSTILIAEQKFKQAQSFFELQRRNLLPHINFSYTEEQDSVKATTQTKTPPSLSINYKQLFPSGLDLTFSIEGKKDKIGANLTPGYALTLSRKNLFTPINEEVIILKRAELDLKVAEKNYQLAEQKLILDVKSAYYKVIKAEKDLEIARDNLKIAQDGLGIIKEKVKDGTALQIDLMKQETLVATAEQNLIKAEEGLGLAHLNFNKTLGRDLDTPVNLEKINLSYEPYQVKLEDCITQALANRPEIIEASGNLEIAKLEVKLAKADLRFSPDISFGYDYWLDNGQEFSGSIIFSLYDSGASKTKVLNAQSKLKQAEINMQAQKEKIITDLRQVLSDLRQKEEELKVLAKSRKQAKENLKIIEKKYEKEFSTIWELSKARFSLGKVKLDYFQALLNYDLAKETLLREFLCSTKVKR